MLMDMVWFHTNKGTPPIPHNIQDFPENREEKFSRLWSRCCVDNGLGRDTRWVQDQGTREGWRDTVEGQRSNTGLTQGQESSGPLLVRIGEAALQPGAAIFCQVWADSQGGLSAFSNIPTFIYHLLFQAWSQPGWKQARGSLPWSQMHRCDCALKTKKPPN